MIKISYRHPLHGKQDIECHRLVNKEGVYHAQNVYGETFQTLEFARIDRISDLQGGTIREKQTRIIETTSVKEQDERAVTLWRKIENMEYYKKYLLKCCSSFTYSLLDLETKDQSIAQADNKTSSVPFKETDAFIETILKEHNALFEDRDTSIIYERDGELLLRILKAPILNRGDFWVHITGSEFMENRIKEVNFYTEDK